MKNVFVYRFIIYKVTGGVTDSDSSYETAVNVVNIYCMPTSRTKFYYVVNKLLSSQVFAQDAQEHEYKA